MDKTSRKILKYLRAKDTEFTCDFNDGLDFLSAEIHVPTDTARAAIRWLKEQGYLEYIKYTSGGIAAFHLSHMGRHLAYFTRKALLKYIADKWIDFFALLISIGALTLSLIALLR